jgi:predicted neuraminidase
MIKKRIWLVVFVLSALSSWGLGQEADLPEPATPGIGGYLEGDLIFTLASRPTPECHASTLAETPSGIVAAWFGGTREKDPDVGIWLSRLADGQWTVPVEVVNGVQSEALRYPCWNPVLFRASDGSLLLFYKMGPSPREWWGEMMSSSDDGLSWSKPWKLGEDRLGPLLGPVKNKPILLDDGSLLCPSRKADPLLPSRMLLPLLLLIALASRLLSWS